jgi:hypothetical protein
VNARAVKPGGKGLRVAALAAVVCVTANARAVKRVPSKGWIGGGRTSCIPMFCECEGSQASAYPQRASVTVLQSSEWCSYTDTAFSWLGLLQSILYLHARRSREDPSEPGGKGLRVAEREFRREDPSETEVSQQVKD